MSNIFRKHPGRERLLKSPWYPVLVRAMTIQGITLDWADDHFHTYRLTSHGVADGRDWQATTALDSLGRVIREHPAFAGDPTFRLLYLRVAVDYLMALAR